MTLMMWTAIKRKPMKPENTYTNQRNTIIGKIKEEINLIVKKSKYCKKYIVYTKIKHLKTKKDKETITQNANLTSKTCFKKSKNLNLTAL